MVVVVAYDVKTESPAGRRRLRRVAQTCENYGQRVQKSVFECSVNEAQFEEVIRRLLDIIEKSEDSLRVYRLMEPKDKYAQVYGLDETVNFEEPLIL